MKNDKTKEVIERLEAGIKELYNSDRYKNYLKIMSKFHNYSFNNSLLIFMQKPDATHVAGFNAWKKNFNRHVNKGQKGIQVLAPATYKRRVEMQKIDVETQKPVLDASGKPVTEMVEVNQPYFKPVYVFDVSQTSGEPLPEIAPELKANVENFDAFYKSLEAVSPFPIEKENITGGAKGYCDPVNKRIAIKEGLSEAHTIKTGIHEIAHAVLHSDLENRDNKDSRTREVEAESIAFIVSDHFGIDTSDYSFGYLAAWSSDKELKELKSSLTTIQKTANDLINKIDAAYKEIHLAKEQEVLKSLEDGEIDLDRVKKIDYKPKDNSIQINDQTLNLKAVSSLTPDKAPVVKIEWSEHGAFDKGETLSLHEANVKFKTIDEAVVELKKEAAAKGEYHPYYKTRFEINCVYNGQEFTYAGRQDLGDGDGNLIEHIKNFADNEYPISDMKESEQHRAIKEFVNYLEQHDLLEQMKDVATSELARNEMIMNSNATPELKAEAQQHYNYNQAMIDYVEKNCSNLNNGIPGIEAPKKADYIKGLETNERMNDKAKESIKGRMAAAKERSEGSKSEKSLSQSKNKSKLEAVR